jgi:hypothetical protein
MTLGSLPKDRAITAVPDAAPGETAAAASAKPRPILQADHARAAENRRNGEVSRCFRSLLITL